ncbi:hypothetical protein SDC9_185074 [bioreactor metagenome]|uniref:Uncharacterized protein n=1 Tax=bioreactor metagenome TaxID=1076179 RepID=A0A645HN73_9ZZZZ
MLINIIHTVIRLAYLLGQGNIQIDIGFQRFLQHFLRHIGHARQIHQRFHQWSAFSYLDGNLGNIKRMITDPLQVGGNFQTGANDAQIPCQWLLAGNKHHAFIFNIHFNCVNDVITGHDLTGQVDILCCQGFNRFTDR